ncbi:glycosyltransferase family 32 protein [Tatumella sp. UBA2305]|uniref:glycosyltransferase family 32 protein n=1 Tax=Tatumella sp. UBA2305 TaxID=1947647 RepID=UPI0039C9C095
MIPKIIHYCWFGNGDIPDDIRKIMDSWLLFCPDYEIKSWNEDSFDISSSQYTKKAYKHKKFAFVSDYVRAHALFYYGGVNLC